MSLRYALIGFSLLASVSVLSGESAVVASESRPNVLFVFADDQCYRTINALGNEEIQTPTLDALAARGTTFTHCFNMGSWSGAVCVASRTMLNTGRFVWRANAVYETSEAERVAGRWWSEYMKKAGYRTYFTGKWHCMADAEKAFDVAHHVRPGMPNQTPTGYNRPLADGTDPWSPSDPKFGGYWKGGRHWSEIVADDAVAFLEDARRQDKPFFMYVAFNAPHDPRQSPREFVDRYPVENVAVPVNYLPVYPHKDQIGLGVTLRDEMLATFPRSEYGVRVNRQEYYAIITHMDQQIGRILAQLESTDQADNTWVIFTADHGLACGQHGLMGKQNMYDHSLRVPFMVVGPGVKKGQRISKPIYLQDAMATALDLAEVQKPGHVEFHSIRPMLDGAPSPYDSIYGAYLELQRAIRTDDYKLVLYPKAKIYRLFDLNQDPEEMVDLASRTDMQTVIKKLFSKLLEQQERMDDTLDLKHVYPQLSECLVRPE